jgi:hypothetical protein
MSEIILKFGDCEGLWVFARSAWSQDGHRREGCTGVKGKTINVLNQTKSESLRCDHISFFDRDSNKSEENHSATWEYDPQVDSNLCQRTWDYRDWAITLMREWHTCVAALRSVLWNAHLPLKTWELREKGSVHIEILDEWFPQLIGTKQRNVCLSSTSFIGFHFPMTKSCTLTPSTFSVNLVSFSNRSNTGPFLIGCAQSSKLSWNNPASRSSIMSLRVRLRQHDSVKRQEWHDALKHDLDIYVERRDNAQ